MNELLNAYYSLAENLLTLFALHNKRIYVKFWFTLNKTLIFHLTCWGGKLVETHSSQRTSEELEITRNYAETVSFQQSFTPED